MVNISEKKRLYTTAELIGMGATYYEINKLINEGELSQIDKSVYETVNYSGEESDFYYAKAYAPDGVICLMSAAVFYGISTDRPSEIDVAIPRGKKISRLPDWPELHVVTFTSNRYSTGIVEQVEGDNKYCIYDMEKTVVDILLNRNKVGIEETKEILMKYLGREDRNLNKLHEYAMKLRCEKMLRTYLEVLI
jgi:predicted transcriptional regulator of viral defense system